MPTNQFQVEVPKVDAKKVDEGLECILKMRTKLYRFSDNQWKECGVGNLKLLRDRKERKIRVLMRQEKTHKPVANFLRKSLQISKNISYCINIVSEDPLCVLTLMANNTKAYVWTCADFSDGESKIEKQAARF